MKLAVEKKIIGGFGLVLLTLSLIGVLAHRGITQLLPNNNAVDYTFKTLNELETLLSLLKDAEIGQRGYLLTGKEAYLAPYKTATTRLDSEIKLLRQLTLNNVTQRQQLDALEPLINRRMVVLQQTIDLYRSQRPELAVRVVQNGEGKRLMDQIRLMIGEMEQKEKQLISQRSQRLEAIARQTLYAITAVILLTFLFIPLVVSIITREMNGRKLSEAALQKSEARLKRLVESDIIGIIFGQDDKIIQANDAFLKMVGYSNEEMLAGLMDWTKMTPPEYKHLDQHAITELSTSGVCTPFEKEFICKDGSRVAILLGVALLEPPLTTVCFALDVTERKQAKEQLQAYAARLERSNQELQSFASVASHDLQEPLRKIQTFGDRLRTKYGDSLTGQGQDYLERMLSAAARMQTLISNVLSLSQVTTQSQPFVSVNLAEVVQDVLSDLEVTIQQTAAQIDLGTLPTLEAEPTQMHQLLKNLISNALKFHPATPIVKIFSQPLQPISTTENVVSSNSCQILVKDNGIGFDEKYRDRIFGVFQRLHNRSDYEGTGIGLSICQKIVERHGGTITAQSQPGKGATFIVTLPMTQLKQRI